MKNEQIILRKNYMPFKSYPFLKALTFRVSFVVRLFLRSKFSIYNEHLLPSHLYGLSQSILIAQNEPRPPLVVVVARVVVLVVVLGVVRGVVLDVVRWVVLGVVLDVERLFPPSTTGDNYKMQVHNSNICARCNRKFECVSNTYVNKKYKKYDEKNFKVHGCSTMPSTKLFIFFSSKNRCLYTTLSSTLYARKFIFLFFHYRSVK